ncbi:MAG: hypothetical protein AABX55_02085 [Nanoarchaeota archaeon]
MGTAIIYRIGNGEWRYDVYDSIEKRWKHDFSEDTKNIPRNYRKPNIVSYFYSFKDHRIISIEKYARNLINDLNSNGHKKINFSLEFVLDPHALEEDL